MLAPALPSDAARPGGLIGLVEAVVGGQEVADRLVKELHLTLLR